jgi:hypothetical protein
VGVGVGVGVGAGAGTGVGAVDVAGGVLAVVDEGADPSSPHAPRDTVTNTNAANLLEDPLNIVSYSAVQYADVDCESAPEDKLNG